MAVALVMHNAESGPTATIPVLGMQAFRRTVLEAVDGGRRIASMFDRAGFRRVLETGAHSAGLTRLLVRLDLAG